VIVFEDLHWADEAMLAFIEHLADRAEAVPLLVVGADCDTLHNIESISMVVPALVARYPYHREAGQ
jgi:predicted ATPase